MYTYTHTRAHTLNTLDQKYLKPSWSVFQHSLQFFIMVPTKHQVWQHASQAY